MTWKLSDRSKRNLRGVHPDLVRVVMRALEISPLDFVVIEGLRTKARQAELVKSGASQTMNSRHLTGHAVDLMPIGPGGARFDWPLYQQLAPAIKQAAADCGVKIVWGGDWSKFRDGPHFELEAKAYPASDWTTGDAPPKERTSVAQTGTAKASLIGGGAALGGVGTAIGALDGQAQIVVVVLGFVTLAAFAWLFRSRIRRWAEGDRQ